MREIRELRLLVRRNTSAASLTDAELAALALARDLPTYDGIWASSEGLPLLDELGKRLVRRTGPNGARVGGTLAIGNNDRGEVIVDIGQELTGHIVFSPDQARSLAAIVIEKACEGDRIQDSIRN